MWKALRFTYAQSWLNKTSICASALLLGIYTLAGAATTDVNLTGRLVNEIGQPIRVLCAFTLKQALVTGKSDPASGIFSITGTTNSLNRTSKLVADPFIRGRTLYFNARMENQPFTIDMFDAFGRAEARILNAKVSRGAYAIQPLAYLIPFSKSGVHFVRVKTLGATAVFMLPTLAGWNSGEEQKGLSAVSDFEQAAGASLQKKSVGALDTLTVACGDYPAVKVPVDKYIGNLRQIVILTSVNGGLIQQDVQKNLVTMSDGKSRLILRLNYKAKCMLDQVTFNGQSLVESITGVSTAIKLSGGAWYTTRGGIATPSVAVQKNIVTVDNISYGGAGMTVAEKWVFTTHPDYITWRIDRKYLASATLDDSYLPGWDFASMKTWDGAILDHGGVAWSRFLETNSASLGAHAGVVTLWNRQNNACLRIVPTFTNGANLSVRVSHQPSGIFTLAQNVTRQNLEPKYELRRYLADKQDVWKSYSVAAGDSMSVSFDLWPLAYDSVYDRGDLKGINESAVREIMNTIGRYGVVDKKLFGGNGWRTGYACLHEQWWPEIALAMADPDYSQGLMESYDYYRDRAVGADGRVKPRFKDTPEDAMAGTYDSAGFYEARWGYLMDSQPDYVQVVAEHFQTTGDLAWAKGQKETCEKVLEYLLKRDSDGDGLLEMINNNHGEGKSSDWIDVIWASYENGLVNAEMYSALDQWADVEDVLGDNPKAMTYRAAAAKLKTAFNKPIDQGGLWNPQKNWYVYWRDKDNSTHGDNLTMPVNISAIAYGICDDSTRIRAILSQMETKMLAENLFFWPLAFNSFAPGEGIGWQWPFPNYENGDIFLSWGELAVRAYSKYDPAIALKYVKNVVNKYEQDGLAFQRYLRLSQQGTGDDILSGNSMVIAGLYRDLYGIRPMHNGLYLEPHLTPELNGTKVRYWLRGQIYTIDLSVNDYAVTINGVTVRDSKPFAVDDDGNKLDVQGK